MLLDHLPDASVMFFGPDTRIILAAGRLLVTSGWSPEEIKGTRLSDFSPRIETRSTRPVSASSREIPRASRYRAPAFPDRSFPTRCCRCTTSARR